MIIGIIALILIVVFIGGVRRAVLMMSTVLPIVLVAFFVYIFIYIGFNFGYFGQALIDIFRGAIGSTAIFGGATGITFAMAIKQGASRGLFANEAGQGTTPHFAAIPLMDHPVKMGFAQSIAVFVDTAIICAFAGIFFTIAIEKSINSGFDINEIQNSANTLIQQNFISHCTYAFLPDVWDGNFIVDTINRICAIIFSIIVFTCGLGVCMGGVVMSEYATIFLFRRYSHHIQQNVTYGIRGIILLSVLASPLIMQLSKNIFSLADLSVAGCFFINFLTLPFLSKSVKRCLKNFDQQLYKEVTEFDHIDKNKVLRLKNLKLQVKAYRNAFINHE